MLKSALPLRMVPGLQGLRELQLQAGEARLSVCAAELTGAMCMRCAACWLGELLPAWRVPPACEKLSSPWLLLGSGVARRAVRAAAGQAQDDRVAKALIGTGRELG